MYNPSLRSEPRRQPAAVLPLQRGSSILDWLESSGRLIARDVNEAEYLESEEEISELMGVDDSAYEDDDDDDLDLED